MSAPSPIHAEAAELRLKIAAHCTQVYINQVGTRSAEQTKKGQ